MPFLHNANQGNYKNVLFWTPSQFDLVQLDENDRPKLKYVLFNSSYSTGKTEVIKGMMRKLLVKKQKCHFIFCSLISQTRETDPILILQMRNEFKQFRDNIKFTVIREAVEIMPIIT